MARIDKPLKYDANQIISIHQLNRGLDCELLARLERTKSIISPEWTNYLEIHRLALRRKGEYWNEEELKMNFLAHVFFVTQLVEDEKIDIFYERALSWEYAGKTERVICDCLLAKPFGIYAPQVPYFFYKNSKNKSKMKMPKGKCY